MRRVFVLTHEQARQRALECVRTAPEGFGVAVGEPTRTLQQNAAQWPILEAFSQQLRWPINGAIVKMSADDWKDVLTATFRGEQARLSQTLDGRVVMLGARTSEFTKPEFSDWIAFLEATAADRGVETDKGQAVRP